MNELDAIETAAERVRKVSRVLSGVFTVVFYGAVALFVAILILSIYTVTVSQAESAVAVLSAGVRIVFESFVVIFTIWVMRAVFLDIAKGQSPFTEAQAGRLRIAAVLQGAHAVFVTLTSPAIINALGLSEAVFGISIGASSAATSMRFIPINVGDIVLAIVLFCAALIVEYGSLLQKLSDDTL